MGTAGASMGELTLGFTAARPLDGDGPARQAAMPYRWHCVKPPYASWVASTRRLRAVN